MKKRLRKKLLLHEFTVWHWLIIFRFHPGLTFERLAEIKDGFYHLLAISHLTYSGACGVKNGIYLVEADKRYESVTEANRQTLLKYLQTQKEIKIISAKGLIKA